jgi:hypothetical protein
MLENKRLSQEIGDSWERSPSTRSDIRIRVLHAVTLAFVLACLIAPMARTRYFAALTIGDISITRERDPIVCDSYLFWWEPIDVRSAGKTDLLRSMTPGVLAWVALFVFLTGVRIVCPRSWLPKSRLFSQSFFVDVPPLVVSLPLLMHLVVLFARLVYKARVAAGPSRFDVEIAPLAYVVYALLVAQVTVNGYRWLTQDHPRDGRSAQQESDCESAPAERDRNSARLG